MTPFPKLTMLVLIFLLVPLPCWAKIYKYQKDGVWYYTDTPPENMPQDREEMPESGRPAPAPPPGGTVLLAGHPTRNHIEKAAAATVAIKTALGYGSGFFISTSGHIITNKHVVRMPARVSKKAEAFFNGVDNRVEDHEKRFAEEKKRIDQYAAKLKRLKKLAATERDRGRKKSYQDEYEHRRKEYDEWKAGYAKRKQKFESRKKEYESDRGDYHYRSSVANLSQSFTIVLVDDTELYVRLVKVSANHDLALLKLDGHRTPALEPASSHQLAQGDPVYAIGNPAKLRNTVTSGIFSGFAGRYIQTNAQINPGNSGGPLIDPQGRVLGVNTKKKVGSAIEGLGFAIPIQTVLEEFAPHLP